MLKCAFAAMLKYLCKINQNDNLDALSPKAI